MLLVSQNSKSYCLGFHFLVLSTRRRTECTLTLPSIPSNDFTCSFNYVQLQYGDSEEDSSVFSLIRMRWLRSARACGE